MTESTDQRSVRAIWSSVDTWARRSGHDCVATMDYALSAEKLILTVHDEAGWLSSVANLTEGPVSTILADARFDETEINHEAHCLRLVKRFDDCRHPPSEQLMSALLGDERRPVPSLPGRA